MPSGLDQLIDDILHYWTTAVYKIKFFNDRETFHSKRHLAYFLGL